VSGPVSDRDPVRAGSEADDAVHDDVEVVEARQADVGGMAVARALPRRARRTVGAWCFADHFGPAAVAAAAMQVGPHPHIGLHTATWIIEGEVVHRDSLGTQQPIRPGQLNLMTAGRGVSHAEETPASRVDTLEGVQLWLAQPDATRFGDPAFAHHGELPRDDVDGATVTVFLGAVAGLTSAAELDVEVVGAEIELHGPATLPVDPSYEHAVLTLGSSVSVRDRAVGPAHLVYLAPGRDEIDIARRRTAVPPACSSWGVCRSRRSC
jgi:quercetin 2,3-dioxygenase